MPSIDLIKAAIVVAVETEEALESAEEATGNARERHTEADTTLSARLEELRGVLIAVALGQKGPPLLRRVNDTWETDKETQFCYGRVVAVGLSHEQGPDPFIEVDEPDDGDSMPRSFRIPVERIVKAASYQPNTFERMLQKALTSSTADPDDLEYCLFQFL